MMKTKAFRGTFTLVGVGVWSEKAHGWKVEIVGYFSLDLGVF